MIEASRPPVASDEVAGGHRIVRTRACIHRVLFALLLAGAGASAAEDIDPLHSSACEAAQAVLERALQEAAGGSAAAREALGADRRQAMEACLGPQIGHDQRSGAPSIPIQVHSPALGAAQEGKALPQVAAPPAPVHVPRPVAITTCDPGGCWDSKGNRLNFMGPVLIGPHGVCTTQAGTVQCPQ